MASLFDFPSRRGWLAVLVCGMLAYGGLMASGVAFRPLQLLGSLGIIGLAIGVAVVYRVWRPDPRLELIAMGGAFMLGIGATAGVLTYLAAAWSGPLWDGYFVAFERALGIDWPAMAERLAGGPALSLFWALAYASSLVQVACAVLVLGHLGERERLARYLTMLLGALVAVDVLSALMPAIGPIRTYGLAPELAARLGDAGVRHLDHFFALREGRLGLLDLSTIEGIITFPSFHAVLAILTAWALAPIRIVGAIAMPLNGAVLVSTIPQGGHYLADVLVGSLIALVTLSIAARGTRPAATPAPALMPAE